MKKSRGEAYLQGQITGLAGVLWALVEVLPPAKRKILPAILHRQFEPLIATMLADSDEHSGKEREGMELVRDTFMGPFGEGSGRVTKRGR